MAKKIEHPNKRRMEMTDFQRECFEYYWSLGPDRKLHQVSTYFRKKQEESGIKSGTNYPARNIEGASANGRVLINYDNVKQWAKRWKWRDKIMKRNDIFEDELSHRLADKFARNFDKYYELMHKKMLSEASNIKLEKMRDWKDFFASLQKMKKLVKSDEESEIPNLPNFNIVLNNSSSKENNGKRNEGAGDSEDSIADAGELSSEQENI